jgi:probable addiction module antidote protein
MKNKYGASFEDHLLTQLRDPEFAAEYIMAAIRENDIKFLPIALGDVAKAFGITKLAGKSGVHRRTLYKVFEKNSNPSFELVTKIANQLGLQLQIVPKRKSKKAP